MNLSAGLYKSEAASDLRSMSVEDLAPTFFFFLFCNVLQEQAKEMKLY